jgi:drug/metabolite transporter (DMT)-like permease
MVGVISMTNPQFIFTWLEPERGFDLNEYPYFYLGVFFALSDSIGSGFAYLMMRKIGKRINTAINPFWFGLYSI